MKRLIKWLNAQGVQHEVRDRGTIYILLREVPDNYDKSRVKLALVINQLPSYYSNNYVTGHSYKLGYCRRLEHKTYKDVIACISEILINEGLLTEVSA